MTCTGPLPPEGIPLPRGEAQLRGIHAPGASTYVGPVLMLVGAAAIAFGILATPVREGDDFGRIVGYGAAALIVGVVLKRSSPHQLRRALEDEFRRSGGEPWTVQRSWARAAPLRLAPWPPSRRRVVVVGSAAAVILVVLLANVVRAAFASSEAAPLDWTLWAGGAAVLALIAVDFHQRRKAVAAVVHFDTFPLLPGARAVTRLAFDPNSTADVAPTEVWLRCVRESAGDGSRGWDVRVVVGVLGAVRVLAENQRMHEVSFDVPADAPPTAVLATPAHRWELIVLAAHGPDQFLGATAAPVFAAQPSADVTRT